MKNRGLWWQFPSFTDEPLGPWSRNIGPAQYGRIQLWKLAIDWMADNGVTHFIGVLESPLKGAVHSLCPDWPFHYVCKWKDFPGAKIFPDKMLEENRADFRKILLYLKEKGIKPFLHHYNHFAPYNWFKNHADLIESAMAGGVSKEDVVKKENTGDLKKNICANAESYRKFMQASWQELFEHLPELEGMLITLGESSYCPCLKCSGGVPRREKWDHILTPEWVNTMSGFAQLYVDTLNELNKKPMIRCYHGGGDRGLASAMPKDVTYIIKYSGFQAMDVEPDPICDFWLNAGHDLWFIHEFAGQENLQASTWINPEHCFNVVKRGNKKRISGQVAFYNDFLGRIGMTYPGMEINEEAGLAAFRGEEYDEKKWEEICQEKLGPNGPVYLQAGKLLSQSIINIDKVVTAGGDDGSAFVFNYYFNGPVRFPGVIGEPCSADNPCGMEPHPWRNGPAPLRRFKEYLMDCPWTDNIYSDALKEGEADPVAYWNEKTELTLQGLNLVERLKVAEDSAYYGNHELFLNSSQWISEWAKFWQGFIRAKVYYWGANSIRTHIKMQRDLANKCIECLEQSTDAIFVMKSLFYKFPALYMRWGRHDYGSMEDKYAHYKKILEDVKKEFEPLVSERYYQWPNGGTWNWPDNKS